MGSRPTASAAAAHATRERGRWRRRIGGPFCTTAPTERAEMIRPFRDPWGECLSRPRSGYHEPDGTGGSTMTDDLLDRYRTASEWTLSKVARAGKQLDAPTPCDDWDVQTLLNHMIETQQYFVQSARGEKASPPSPEPPDGLIGDDAASAY